MPFEHTRSRSRQSKGEPMKADALTALMMAKLKVRTGGNQRESLVKNWGTIVSQKFLNKCEPETVRLGVLYVKTANSAVKQELTFEGRAMLKKIQALADCQKIKRIMFI